MEFKHAVAALALTLLASGCGGEAQENAPQTSPSSASSTPSALPSSDATLTEEKLTEEQAALYADAKKYQPEAEAKAKEFEGSGGASGSLSEGYEVAEEYSLTVEEADYSFEVIAADGTTVAFENGVYSMLLLSPEAKLTNQKFQKDMEALQTAFESYHEAEGEWPSLSSELEGFRVGEDLFEEKDTDVVVRVSPEWLYRGFSSMGDEWEFSFTDPTTGEKAVGTPDGLKVLVPYPLSS